MTDDNNENNQLSETTAQYLDKKDDTGTVFDPDIHLVDEAGVPVKTKSGAWRKKGGRPSGAKTTAPGAKRTGPLPGNKRGGRQPGSASASKRNTAITYDDRLVTVPTMHRIFKQLGGVKEAVRYYKGELPKESKMGEFLKIYFGKLPEREMAILQTEIAHELTQQDGATQHAPQLNITLTHENKNNNESDTNTPTE